MSSLYGISETAIVRAIGVDRRTARRWKRAGRVPSIVAPLLRIRFEGDLADLDAAWCGWKLHRGDLWSPEGHAFSPGDLRALPYLRDLHAELLKLQSQPKQLDLALPSLAEDGDGPFLRPSIASRS